MNVNLKRAAAAAVLCLGLTVAASAAGAQDRPAGPGGPPHGDRAAERQKMFENVRHQREQRLHDLLQIRPDQDGAFRAYLAALESQRKPGERGPGRDGRPGEPKPQERAMTTPERLDRMTARMAERQQRFQQKIAATKTFYAALNADQRKAFDAMPRMGGEGRRGGHRGHFGGRGPGFEGPPPRG